MVVFENSAATSTTTITLKNPSFAPNCNDEFCSLILSPREEMIKNNQKKACKHEKCQLVDYDSLPSFLKHNEFILDHYRSEWPLKETILSIFSIHNETINVWTHLIGFFIFLFLTLSAAAMISTTTSTAKETISVATTVEKAPRWPLYSYLAGAMFCLLMSSACHLLSCHSEKTCYVLLRLDYTGITGLIVTSFYPLVYYSFACQPFFLNLYICFITVFGVATITVSLLPAFETPAFRAIRIGLFICMAVSGLVPIVHKSVAFGDRPEVILTTWYETAMGVFYGLAVVIYVARVPERWLPGKFDIAGHSHQLFHVLVIAGAYSHYLAGLIYLRWRDNEGC